MWTVFRPRTIKQTRLNNFVKTPEGFTIIELLIVIVVIAILASISVVAYSGVSRKAEDTVVISKVTAIVKMFKAYAAANDGHVPQADWACVGEPGDFQAESGYDADWCKKPLNADPIPAGSTHPVNTTLNTALKTIVGRVPNSRLPEVDLGTGNVYRGMHFDSSATQNGGLPDLIFYVKGSRTSCPIGTFMGNTATSTRCEYFFTDVTSETGT